MSDTFSKEMTAEVLALINMALDAREARASAQVPPVVQTAPAAIPLPLQGIKASDVMSFIPPSVVLPDAVSKSPKVRKEPTAAQLAADAVDPERNVYTALCRKWSPELSNEIWHVLQAQMWAAGHPKGRGTNVLCTEIHGERKKLEAARLAARDKATGLVGAPPLVAAEKIRSLGTHSDPTANQAIYNADRDVAARLAAIQLEYQSLTGGQLFVTLPGEKQAASAVRSAAQKRVGQSGWLNTINKLARDAQASGDAAGFVNTWLAAKTAKTPRMAAPFRKQAVEALKLLGIQVA